MGTAFCTRPRGNGHQKTRDDGFDGTDLDAILTAFGVHYTLIRGAAGHWRPPILRGAPAAQVHAEHALERTLIAGYCGG